MTSKIVGVVLILAIPGFLGYPAALNLDPKQKGASPSTENSAEIWPAPPATTVTSLPALRYMIPTQTDGARSLEGEFLAKELQRQLRRVGCYGGDITGGWSQSTRRAMQTFLNRVNATLPLDQPDDILLAMLQSYPDKTCNKPCSSGEKPAPDGGCVPETLGGPSIKAPDARPVPRITSWIATETAAANDGMPTVYKMYRAPLTAAPVRPSPPPKRETATVPKPSTRRPPVNTANREQPRTLQRHDREQSRTTQHSDFVRTLFQRLDGSGR